MAVSFNATDGRLFCYCETEMDNNKQNSEKTREILINHIKTYPKAQAEDIFKFIFQSSFGCEHLVADEKSVLEYIDREYVSVDKKAAPLTEQLDGDYSRVYLSHLNCGLRSETLARLFCLSAKKESFGKARLEEKLKVACELVADSTLPLDKEIFNEKLITWESKGHPALHHSDEYRKAYRPSYRVISDKYVEFLEIFAVIDRLSVKDDLIIAIEGGSASGKTTLTGILQELYDCNVFHMDDFFLRPEQRTAERFAEIGGNVDRERFAEEVLSSVKKGETVRYRPFDCSVQTLGEEVTVQPKKLTIIEGVYSTHPAFSRYYDYMIFLDIDPEFQKQRILVRNSPQLAKRFFDEWIPLENTYFSGTDIKARADMIKKVKSCKDANDDR